MQQREDSWCIWILQNTCCPYSNRDFSLFILFKVSSHTAWNQDAILKTKCKTSTTQTQIYVEAACISQNEDSWLFELFDGAAKYRDGDQQDFLQRGNKLRHN